MSLWFRPEKTWDERLVEWIKQNDFAFTTVRLMGYGLLFTILAWTTEAVYEAHVGWLHEAYYLAYTLLTGGISYGYGKNRRGGVTILTYVALSMPLEVAKNFVLGSNHQTFELLGDIGWAIFLNAFFGMLIMLSTYAIAESLQRAKAQHDTPMEETDAYELPRRKQPTEPQAHGWIQRDHPLHRGDRVRGRRKSSNRRGQ